MTVLTPFLRHLNTGTLAIFLFVALAYLTSIRGREVETKGSHPKIFTVSPGAAVTWINHDKVPHVISSTGNQFQKSPVLQPRQSFSSIFAAAGTYSYSCSIHPRMTGKIIVN